jgi:glucokinase
MYEPVVSIVDEWLEYLSNVICNICLFYDPEVIGIGGGIVASKDYWLAKLTEKTKTKIITKANYEIKIAMHGNDAGFIGAAFACDM